MERLIFVLMRVVVTLKPGVQDPEGATITDSLQRIGFASVNRVTVGRHFDIEIPGRDEDRIRREVEKMCESLLVNPVLQDYHIERIQGPQPAG